MKVKDLDGFIGRWGHLSLNSKVYIIEGEFNK